MSDRYAILFTQHAILANQYMLLCPLIELTCFFKSCSVTLKEIGIYLSAH